MKEMMEEYPMVWDHIIEPLRRERNLDDMPLPDGMDLIRGRLQTLLGRLIDPQEEIQTVLDEAEAALEKGYVPLGGENEGGE